MKQTIDNYQFERKLYSEGIEYIAGTDEVGRGPLAGPVVATAVIMPKNCYIEGVTDSKKITPKKRKELRKEIETKALSIVTVFIDESKIDEINIYGTFENEGLDFTVENNTVYLYTIISHFGVFEHIVKFKAPLVN